MRGRAGRFARWIREREGTLVLIGAAVGLALSIQHVAGLAIGGLLVGLPARSTGRALGYGLAFGGSVWLLFAGALAANGDFSAALGMGPVGALSLLTALGLPTLAAGVRGLL